MLIQRLHQSGYMIPPEPPRRPSLWRRAWALVVRHLLILWDDRGVLNG